MEAAKKSFSVAALKTNVARVAAVAVVSLSTLAGAFTPAYASRADVRVFNRSTEDVIAIHAAPTYRPVYGRQDLLGRFTLDAGYNVMIDFDVPDAEDRCLLDVLALGRAGSRWTKRMNVCEETRWTLGD